MPIFSLLFLNLFADSAVSVVDTVEGPSRIPVLVIVVNDLGITIEIGNDGGRTGCNRARIEIDDTGFLRTQMLIDFAAVRFLARVRIRDVLYVSGSVFASIISGLYSAYNWESGITTVESC